jgi:uncharacterized repeat protein (TIGR01451 family)
MVVSNPKPNVDDTVTFTVPLTNAGPVTATNVEVSDLLPAGLLFVSATPSQGVYDSGSGLWMVGTVTPTTPQTLQLNATVVSPSARTNTAVISQADQFDRRTGNNIASATETPQQADLATAKGVDNPPPIVGATVTFTVALSNNGRSAAMNVGWSISYRPGSYSCPPGQARAHTAPAAGCGLPAPSRRR